MPRTFMGAGGGWGLEAGLDPGGRGPWLRGPDGSRYHTRLAGGISAACASLARVHASARGLQTHRDSYAKRQSPRKRAFRVCPAPLQAHLREGRRAGRNPQARVLREADPGAQAQGRRRREAPGAPHLARRHQAPAPVLRQARVLPLARPARRSRLSTQPARASVAGFLSLQCHPACLFVLQERLQPGSPPHIRPTAIPMTLKHRLTDDMKAAMKSGAKATLRVNRLANAAIKQRAVDERIDLDAAAAVAALEKQVTTPKQPIAQFATPH